MHKFIGMVGSNSTKSTNRSLLEYMQRHFASIAEIELMEVDGLPIFQKTKDMSIPVQAQEMAKKIDAADGVIIATPEWDHSIPAILSSALAWLSYGIHPFYGKTVMITGASFGNLGTSRAQAQLRQILDSPELEARIMPSSEFLLSNSLKAFDATGELLDTEQVRRLDVLFDEFITFTEAAEKINYTHGKEARQEHFVKS